MSTNLLTGSSVGGRNKKEKGEVIQIKVENRFIHTERISVLRSCVSLYMAIKFLRFYSNSKARSV